MSETEDRIEVIGLRPKDIRWLARCEAEVAGIDWHLAPARFEKLRKRGMVADHSPVDPNIPMRALITDTGRAALAIWADAWRAMSNA